VKISGRAVPARVRIGDKVRVSVDVTSRSRRLQPLSVDLSVGYVKADGSRRPKVFKVSVVDLSPRRSVALSKVLSFAQHTTRRHFPGRHTMDVVINGVSYPISPVTVIAR
jgi:hypothetical protein